MSQTAFGNVSLFLLLTLLASCKVGSTEASESTPNREALETTSNARAAGTGAPQVPVGRDANLGQERSREDTAVEVTEEQNGGLVALGIGDRLRVVIDGNPTTGFLWETEHLEASLLRQIGGATFTPYSDLTGSGGDFELTFEAVRAGSTRLRLAYRRAFETGVSPERLYEVLVDIQ